MPRHDQPTVFLAVATPEWFSTARAPKALADAGFRVVVFCPAGQLVAKSRFVDHLDSYAMPIGIDDYYARLATSLEKHQPDLILPGDDLALAFLHRLHRDIPPGHAIRAMLDGSFPPQAIQDTLERKSAQIVVAHQIGIEVPPSLINPRRDEAFRFAARSGFPVMLKHDYSCAGLGVFPCGDRNQLDQALDRPLPSMPFPASPMRTLQAHIRGQGAFVALSAYKGEMLGGFAMRKLHQLPLGPTAVAQRLDNEAPLLAIAEKLVAHFAFTGVADMDFMIDAGTGRPLFLEMNPRWVPHAHLGRALGMDLLAPPPPGCRGQARSRGLSPSFLRNGDAIPTAGI